MARALNTAMDTMAATMRQINDRAGVLTAAAEELSRMAVELGGLVGQFRY